MSGDQNKPNQPEVLWAQRNDCVYVTISISDIKNHVFDVKEKSFSFTAEGVREKPIPYAVNFNFFASVVTEEPPRVSSSGREIVFCFKKVNHAFWPRLLSETVKCSWLKIDFNRWKDEDDEDSEPEMGGGLPNMLSQMSNFKDYGNEELMDDVDSDDEDLPDLDPPTAGETHDEKTEITA